MKQIFRDGLLSNQLFALFGLKGTVSVISSGPREKTEMPDLQRYPSNLIYQKSERYRRFLELKSV